MTADLRSTAAGTRRAHRARALVTGAFAPLDGVSLATVLAQAELQTRLDLKYLVPLDRLAELVDALTPDYAALEIDGRRLFHYESVYFDTPDRLLYRHHLQGRRNRCKVRTRTYLDSGTCMLEVKQDGRRSVTVKTRVPHPIAEAGVLAPAARAHVDSILQGRSGVAARDLDASATTAYLRGTLVDLDGGSRLTCDLDLHCRQDGRVETGLTDHVLIETKSVAGRSVADRVLRAMGIRPLGVSKYCVAIALLDPSLPANRWNRVLRNYFDWTPGNRQHHAAVAGHSRSGHDGGMSTDEDPTLVLLREKERELEDDMRALTTPQQDQGSISFGKRVGDGTAMAVDRLNAVTVHDRLTATLAEVRRAIEKVEEGSREVCDVCGRPIGAGRLEARPWATRCIDHG